MGIMETNVPMSMDYLSKISSVVTTMVMVGGIYLNLNLYVVMQLNGRIMT